MGTTPCRETCCHPRCPACGELIDYCQGHGEIGDPDGFWMLEQHDRGEHQYCDKRGCDDARNGRLFSR